MTSSEVYLLPLSDDGSPQVGGNQYIYLAATSEQPIVVRFAIEGTSSICRHGSLWVNIPEKGAEFRRDHFREFKLDPDFHRTIHISIPIYHPGAFAFYTTYAALPDLSTELAERASFDEEKKTTPRYYIDVAPRLRLDGRPLPLEALSVFSIISKFMGKYPNDWERHLRGISDRGYNMVHFTPLQQRGESNSPYSLYDQLAWDPICFPRGEQDVQDMVHSLKTNHSLLSLTDIVLNHTANNSPWLLDHPDAGYNLKTAPHLESAYLLDSKLLELGDRLGEMGLPTDLKSTDDLDKIMGAIKTECIAGIRLWEYYVLDVENDAANAADSWSRGDITIPDAYAGLDDLAFLKSADLKTQTEFLKKHALHGNDRLGERHRRTIDGKVGAALLTAVLGPASGGAEKDAAHNTLVSMADALNVPFYAEYDAEVADILQQLFNRIKYCRLDDNGPKMGPIGPKSALIETYFTRLPRNEQTAHFDIEELVLVNNGWVWGGNALVDNAGPQSRVYLRREVIVWGDCVKLRYGSGPADSPWLWEHMTQYARTMAKYFAGFRIDNCHSTPMHVAEHILDEARLVNPNLYVVAELFSGSEDTDYIFVKRLGLSSLIREAMQAWSTGEMSRLVHRHGGRPIGSFEVDDITRSDVAKKQQQSALPNANANGHTSEATADGEAEGDELCREIIRRIRVVPVQALFMDCTHDNEAPAQKRDARDTLPNAALVSMCASATGSVMGYDEIYPRLVDLVNETRMYTSESSSRAVKVGSGRNGIGGIKKLLNQIHVLMGKDGYAETHIHHEEEYVTVHRVHPESRKGYFLIAHTAYPGYGNGNGAFNPVHLTGTRANHLGSWMLEVDTSEEATKNALDDTKFLRGLPSRVVDLPGIKIDYNNGDTSIAVPDKFPPGSIALFETWIPAAEHSSGLDTFVTSGAKAAFGELSLVDLNFLLYRCEAEERDASGGNDGVYDLPGYGRLVYAGLQGWYSILKHVVRDNNLAHPLCQNLRDGQWALDYIAGRLERVATKDTHSNLGKPAAWFKERFDAIRPIPAFLHPRYFGLIMKTAYQASWDRAMALMSANVREGQWFVQSLAMVSIQQTGLVQSGSLYPNRLVPSLAAGLPHFAVEWARCWGRDVFISLRGLFLGTGRYAEAKEHILAFASVLKHGMVPNLLGSGGNPRYNARDATWFFLQCIQDYVNRAPDGDELLKTKLKRRFLPNDDTWFDANDPRAYSKESTVEEVIQEALQRHATGMSFREANAGPGLDMQMRDEGFNIDVHVDWSNGFIFGGNQFNCGTWMDKMGESERAGSKGIPGTPRDGAAIEITGLLYSTLKWLAHRHSKGGFAHQGVTRADGSSISFADWAALIQDNFERCYYVPLQPADDAQYDVNPAVVNRRGIYKDLYKSGKEYEDYQLRPNFAIAMTVAADLFDAEHATHALCLADTVLRGPTGMATLDPADLNYRPYYINSEDSTDFATSKGRNYHQGPEWLWPTGFFLRALLKFDLRRRAAQSPDDAEGRTEAFQQVTRRLMGCKEQIQESVWAGLTELTQKDGAYCQDSSPTQAWSAGCLIDLYMDAEEEQARHKTSHVAIR
ncbi:glycogen debranching enzyme [Sporothrix schenckii 1099-18]|uniref:Glycogen debranching enzyme n=1 Tax=Sporothrix schenckii 1099-18 TaxID=1397361 RepID=A0A0F2M6A2_SPOSC|nr:glycogen debranching enzyme [Sporothrix schenckii 1099-18]KJR83711.1 glycogen debranching enzyme [Sporothrix schenckii 1099-18]